MRTLLIILLACSFIHAKANDSIPTTTIPYYLQNGWLKNTQQVMAEKGILTLAQDTSNAPIYPYSGLIYTHYNGSSYWFWNGNLWQQVGTGSITNYVTTNTSQTIPNTAPKIWQGLQTFNRGSGSMFFNGAQLNIRDSFSNGILIGASAGQFISSSNTDIIAIGLNSQRLIGAGSANVSVGDGSLNGVTGNRNTAMGSNALAITDSSDNTAIGYNANVTAYGARNTAIGATASTFQQLYTANLNNTVIVINTKKLGGATIASFISGAGLTVGHKYPMKIVFNGTAPTPFFPTSTLYVQMTVSNSDTLTMNQPAFTGQGTGNFDLYVYSTQNNSIAIGYTATTTGSNQITIGNALDSLLTANKLIVDIATTPTNGQILVYNSGTGKYVPANSGSAIDYSYHTLTYGATTTIDYNTGEKFVLTLTGNTTLAFSNTINGKTIYVLLKQDVTGGHTVTLPSGTIFPLGSNTGYVLNTTTTSNGIDKISITYNNITSNYEVELAKDYGH